MDRRTFLKTLAALGAAIPLPAAVLAEASSSAVDAAWTETTKTWRLFEVSEYGTLSFANFEEPKTRLDAYDLYCPDGIDVDFIQSCSALESHVENLYLEALDKAGDDLAASADRLGKGWVVWFEHATPKTKSMVVAEVEQWLDEPPNWNWESDYLYRTGTGQGAAYRYFLSEDAGILDTLSIVVVEGEHPGSSYYAAELKIGVHEANAIARDGGLDLRFVRE